MRACQISAVVPHMIGDMLNASGLCGGGLGLSCSFDSMCMLCDVVHGYIKPVNLVFIQNHQLTPCLLQTSFSGQDGPHSSVSVLYQD